MSFGIANNVRSEVRVCTPELLEQALDSVQVAHTCAEIEDVLEKYRRGELNKEDFETLKGELKKRLPIATFHATFQNGRRKNEEAIPSGLCIYDLDHIPNPQEKWAEIEARKDELRILLAHITPSTEGLRLVFVIPLAPGTNRLMTLAEAQAWMASMLGDTQYDACVKDYARCSFLVPREYVLFLSEGLFDSPCHPLPSCHPERSEGSENINVDSGCKQILRDAQDDKTGGDAQDDKTESDAQDDKDNVPQDDKKKEYPQTFKGIPYGTIIAEWFRKNGGEPVQGERNAKLHRLASHLRYITDNNEVHLLQIIPSFGLKEEEMRTLIHSACIAKFYGVPRVLKKLLANLVKEREEDDHEELQNDNSEVRNHASDIPEMPKKLPPLIKLLVSKTPKIYQPAVAHAVFPALATHLWKVYFKYIDNVEHQATLMNVLMAGTGAGKNCISEPINHIMKDIRKRDAENLQREKEWKAEMVTKGSNKDKRKRPEGLVIQEVDPDMTNAAFVQRLADAEERFLYAKMNEIDQFDALKTSARSKAHFQIMCLAFDPGNVYGQTRVGTSSVSERVCIRFNWNASTTIQKGQAYFRSVLTDGPISRINFCTIPERAIGAEMPMYGTYDANFDEELRPYIERLNNARGTIECRPVSILAKKLVEECAEFARLSQSRVYENLSFRANVISFLKACVLYVAHGEKWDKTMEDFIRWSLEYDLWCKMKFFGEDIEVQEADAKLPIKGPQNLLNQLPDIFTREEAGLMRQRLGIRSGSLKLMLSNWKQRGYIELYGDEVPVQDIGRQQYTKTEKYLKTH